MQKVRMCGIISDHVERDYINDVMESNHYANGDWVERFENNMSQFLGSKVLTVNSGSSANLLAFYTLTDYSLGDRRIKPGDEVITTAVCFPTTISPIIQYGAIPVFVDVDINTLNIDTTQLDLALSSKTKAIMVAHTLGNPFNLKVVLEWAKKHNLWIIEDNCDALGSKYGGKYTGTLGDIGTLSFYPAHHMTMGEGGAVIVNRPELYNIAYSIRNWGRDCMCKAGEDDKCSKRHSQQFGELPFGYDHKYVCSRFGFNLKITEFQGAIGCAQLEKLPMFIEKRKKNWEYLRENLDGTPLIFQKPETNDVSWFGFSMLCGERNELVAKMERDSIQTRSLFMGNILRQPCFTDQEIPHRKINRMDKSDIVMNNQLWCGVWPGMTRENLDTIVHSIKGFYE